MFNAGEKSGRNRTKLIQLLQMKGNEGRWKQRAPRKALICEEKNHQTKIVVKYYTPVLKIIRVTCSKYSFVSSFPYICIMC